MPPTVADHVARVRAEVGYTESPPGSNRTKYAAPAGHANGQPWCMTFQVAMAKADGLLLPYLGAYTPSAVAAFKAAGHWHTSPAVGDFAFFDFPDSVHRVQHVGLVTAYSPSTITTTDGNTSSGPGGSEDNGGGVFERTRSRSVVVGYGRPIYAPAPPEEDDMADPDVKRLLEQIADRLGTIDNRLANLEDIKARWGRKNGYAKGPISERSELLQVLDKIAAKP